MKKIFVCQLLLLLSMSFVYSETLDKFNIYDGLPDSIIVEEEIVSIKAGTVRFMNYFKLHIKNEDKNSVYSLVRIYPNGEFDSVGLRYGYANSVDTPILYSFLDKEVPEQDFIYVLYRISNETEILKQWNYCFDSKELCESTSEVIATTL